MSPQPTSRRGAARPVTDRWSFKPVALLLLLCTVFAMAGATAVLIGAAVPGRRRRREGAEPAPRGCGRRLHEDPAVPAAHHDLRERRHDDPRADVSGQPRDRPPGDVSTPTRKAVLAIEDSDLLLARRARRQPTFRALVENVTRRQVDQGGSTITQQLVKKTLGLDRTVQSLERKFQEPPSRSRWSSRYSKDRILEMYLNHVYLGQQRVRDRHGVGVLLREARVRTDPHRGRDARGHDPVAGDDDPLTRTRKAWLARNDVLNRMMAPGTDLAPGGTR